MTPLAANSPDDTCCDRAASIQVALSIIGLLPTPELRTAAFLATLRTEVARRSAKEPTR